MALACLTTSLRLRLWGVLPTLPPVTNRRDSAVREAAEWYHLLDRCRPFASAQGWSRTAADTSPVAAIHTHLGVLVMLKSHRFGLVAALVALAVVADSNSAFAQRRSNFNIQWRLEQQQ